MTGVSLSVNGQPVVGGVDPSQTLLELLREQLGLNGTHAGCDTAQCGACTVVVNGLAQKSCNVLVRQLEGASVRSIEDLAAPDGTLHPMQQAFGQHHALQCGYCTPGMVMRAVAMADEDVPAEPEAVRHALCGNLCRCTGYGGIVTAVCQGLRQMRAAPERLA
ncbi:(2Fe-2S)-binding protein [Hydrogenophaga sp. OTU3427]|uniref:(2Fe-2S)-binding protein n=1 Tax=Hydrogenophaga sp. OTU3427 TaxID=3043856 RepID=UPI00313E71A0